MGKAHSCDPLNVFSPIYHTSGLPDSPLRVDILTELSSTSSLTVEWVPGEAGKDVQWFLIDAKKVDGEFSGTRDTAPVGATQYKVTGLDEGITYELAVYSANVYGVNEDYLSDTASTLCKYV